MSRSRRFIGGLSFGYLNQFLVTVAGLWLTPFLLGRVGQNDYGLWLVGTQIMGFMMLLDLGVVALLPRETGFATGRAARSDDREELPRIVGETMRLALWQTPLVALIAGAVWLALPAEWEPLRGPLALVLLTLVLLFPLRVYQATLYGLQDNAFLAQAQLCTWALSIMLTVALVLAGAGLYSLAAGWMTAQVLAVPVLWLRLRRRFPDALPARLPALAWDGARRRLGQGFWQSANQVAQILMFGTDLLIIGKLFGPAAVVPFACTGKLIGVLANQPQMLMHMAGPGLSELKMSESHERVAEVCTALGQAMLLVSGGVVLVVLAVNQGFVTWWVGAENYGGFALTALMLANMLLRHWNLTLGYSVFFFGHDRHLATTGLLDGLVTLGSIAALVWLLGLPGAPLGSLIGVCAVSLPRNLRMLARETGRTAWRTAAPLSAWAWRFLVLATLVGAAANWYAPRGALAVALAGAFAATAYLAVMLPLIMRTALRDYLPRRVGGLLTKLFGVPASSEVV